MSVRKTAGFLSPNRISEMVWDSESEEAGASSDCIIYLGNGILCIFRHPLKYLCFSYSYIDRLRKYVDLISSSEKYTGNDSASQQTQQHSTKFGQSPFVTGTQLKCRM